MSYVVIKQTAKNFDGSKLEYKMVEFESIQAATEHLGERFILDCINQMVRMEMQTSARMAARYRHYEPRLKLDDDDKLLIQH